MLFLYYKFIVIYISFESASVNNRVGGCTNKNRCALRNEIKQKSISDLQALVHNSQFFTHICTCMGNKSVRNLYIKYVFFSNFAKSFKCSVR